MGFKANRMQTTAKCSNDKEIQMKCKFVVTAKPENAIEVMSIIIRYCDIRNMTYDSETVAIQTSKANFKELSKALNCADPAVCWMIVI